ncbi:gamma-glutamyltransferase [Candidatus Microthrix parvicella]|mgnify:FL=1|nr:gamma-glutamyltransferase [Candidatus Microthrix parvicella]
MGDGAALGLVAAGHPVTADAAAAMLGAGGNAWDAAVAAGFAATAAEPLYTSLAGGGFLLATGPGRAPVLFDFFTAVPGLGRVRPVAPPVAVPIAFGAATQTFHVGPGSVAVPGLLPGLLEVHGLLGSLPLAQVVRPAIEAAGLGQSAAPMVRVVSLLAPVMARSSTGAALYLRDGRPLGVNDHFHNPRQAAVLAEIAAGDRNGFSDDELGGAVTSADLDDYRVEARTPLSLDLTGEGGWTNPAPAFGGRLVALGLQRLLADRRGSDRRVPDGAVALADAMVAQAEARSRLVGAVQGTTHLSVIDRWGNVASMTASNGSGSGEFIPGTGIQLNNMMGEEDLHPAGFEAAEPGSRIPSMMAPTALALHGGDRVMALGSGGSERIRSTIMQVAADLVAGRLTPAEAVEAPRMHWDGSSLQVEPGMPIEVLAALEERYRVVEWDHQDLYFGGLHLVATPNVAVGDQRRDGVARVVAPADRVQ